MIRPLLAIALTSTLGMAAAASHRDLTDDAKIEKQLTGRIEGKPQSCISPSPSEGGSHYGNVVLLKDRSGVLYRTHFEGGCTAGDSDMLISQRPTTQLCRGDIITIQDQTSGIFRGSCSYSDFIPYRKP